MKHPLDGAKLKIVRAQKHLNALKNDIALYLSTNPYEFPTEQDGDVLTARPAIIKAGCEPSDEFSCIIGECVGALRHSLDYIAWEIAKRFHVPPPIVGKNRDISFPILDSPTGDSADRFAKMAKKWCFPADAISLIQSIQPYHAGYEPLGALAFLTNTDKHCLPLLTIAYAKTSSIKVNVEGRPLATAIMHPPGSAAILFGHNVTDMEVRQLTPDEVPEPLRPTTEGAKVFSSRFKVHLPGTQNASTPPPSEPQSREVKVDGQVSVFIALKDSLMPFVPIEGTLEQIIKCVANIIPRFETFF